MKILVFDIGGTYIKYALMDQSYAFLHRGRIRTPQDSREQLIEALAEVYRETDQPDGIAISMPGIIDSENGYCRMGGALHYNDDFYLRHALYEVCPVPIVMENDAKCAAMAEAARGSLKDVNDGFVLIFGTMIGGGYIQNRRLVRGKHFSAGEISYIRTEGRKKQTDDSLFGLACGTPALCRSYAERKGLPPESVTGITVFDAVNSGEPEAADALNEFTSDIAVQIFNLQTILDPERFAIGGGISAQPVFTEYIRKNLKQLYAECPYTIPQAEVVTCRFQNDANLAGALSCFLAETGQQS